MKLENRERVDGTCVTIGHRVFNHQGRQKIGTKYTAEYRDGDGKQVCESLKTTNRVVARRRALEIQQRLDSGADKPKQTNITVSELADRYFGSVKGRDLAIKTEWKYRTDLRKLKEFCEETGIFRARNFSEEHLHKYRSWLINKPYATKTVQGAVVLAKQMFKWAWRQRILSEYRLASVSFPKAKAKPQPCFTTSQVMQLIEVASGEEKTAFAFMAFSGLRIGEVEQLRWEDLCNDRGRLTMIHVRRGGSNGTTKDKDHRFVPMHPVIAGLLTKRKQSGIVLPEVKERDLLDRLKTLCESCGFEKPRQYKLHSFRHHFASICANNHIAHRKALAWLGHSSSDMLDLYYHLHDEDSQHAMRALANNTTSSGYIETNETLLEGSLRTAEESIIEKKPQAPELQELVACIETASERAGFEPAVQV